MSRLAGFAAAAGLAAALATGASAAEAGGPAAGVDVFSSSDADGTTVTKWGLDLDARRLGPEAYQGMRLELARFQPSGEATTQTLRGYYRFAERGGSWTWGGQVGTDGRSAIGALSLHNEGRLRQEYFLERDIVETRKGLDQGIYYTFAGAAFDLPLSERQTVTLVGGVQDFTGRNVRLHARFNYVAVLKPEWGLSAQLRARYFQSSVPREFDYFSPRHYAQITPTVQLRRRVSGWRLVLAGGLGAQRQTGLGWRKAVALDARLASPPLAGLWSLEAAASYSNTPVSAGYTYDYRQFALGLRRPY